MLGAALFAIPEFSGSIAIQEAAINRTIIEYELNGQASQFVIDLDAYDPTTAIGCTGSPAIAAAPTSAHLRARTKRSSRCDSLVMRSSRREVSHASSFGSFSAIVLSPSSSAALAPRARARATSESASGTEVPRSHFETVWRTTWMRSANSS